MDIYLVGGAVRDALLGLPVTDRDWVVVGATPEQMLAAGYRQVGADFPVFLHPETNEEYALARTERKQGRGYHGFTVHSAPDVTLEEDLQRRDLTINAMAQTTDGKIIDPFNGQADLARRELRHVSAAFSEDPLRILRTARFLARFSTLGFTVTPDTLGVMRQMVEAGEVQHLVPERVWQEMQRALQENNPVVFFEVLDQCGALSVLVPEFEDEPCLKAALSNLRCACQQPSPTDVRFAALLAALQPEQQEARAKALKAPNECLELARLTARLAERIPTATSPAAQLAVLDDADVWRRPERFERLLSVGHCLPNSLTTEVATTLRQAYAVANKVNARALMAQGFSGPELGAAIHRERLRRIAESTPLNHREDAP
ncbi:multifunctional CCA tRNA nucleotidyl transferase/2'3'-cyclic phosphodiesterase/2'nucleotidase/phosphatase [Marinobacter caseinilyticus]|uniref:multifunctional CCA tRNA nucleotidyl transferase/2'3'-cyclic phosphodiesterase/2'nucleotidase/phosphatase n=1 Tax=Marinobacter caseinilyticus TaxID=2692195 RepID=UPI00140B2962|nr:multifunctional CCA tRNA nucleotidyl transferase/2'3'-cyclic phosphodiesterase/2'nucleotidase/phosphatase [Marinobacter caseinilyticus]